MTSAGGCWSYVGKQSDTPYQLVSVGPGCDMVGYDTFGVLKFRWRLLTPEVFVLQLGTATHELMHAIGFWHQQSRSDRDDYVYIDFSNIIPSQAYNFQKMSLDTAQLLNVPYDYGSVMQYYPCQRQLILPKHITFCVQMHSQLTPRNTRFSPRKLRIKTAWDSEKHPRFPTWSASIDCIIVQVSQRDFGVSYWTVAGVCKKQMTCSNCGFTDSRNCSQCKCPHYFSGPTCDNLPVGTSPNCNGAVLQVTEHPEPLPKKCLSRRRPRGKRSQRKPETRKVTRLQPTTPPTATGT